LVMRLAVVSANLPQSLTHLFFAQPPTNCSGFGRVLKF